MLIREYIRQVLNEQPDFSGRSSTKMGGQIFVVPFATEDESGYGGFWAKLIRANSQEEAVEYFQSSLEGGDSWIWGAARDEWGSTPEHTGDGMWYMTGIDMESEDQEDPDTLVYAITPRPEMVKGFDTEDEAIDYARYDLKANVHGQSVVDTHEMME